MVHRIGSCTVTSLVPSGKVASTCTSGIISAIPSITWARVSTCAPASISSATGRPSRAPSTTKSVIKAIASGWLSLTPRSRRRRATLAAMAISSLSFSRGVRFIANFLQAPQARHLAALRQQSDNGNDCPAQGDAGGGKRPYHELFADPGRAEQGVIGQGADRCGPPFGIGAEVEQGGEGVSARQ